MCIRRRSSGQAALLRGSIDFAQRCAELAEAGFAAAPGEWELAVARTMAARLAKKEALSEAEMAAARMLIESGRLPLIGCRWVAKGVLHLIPVVGWLMLGYDAITLTPSIADALGKFLFAPPDAQALAWKDPWYTVLQQPMGDHVALFRGVQLRATPIVDRELPVSSMYGEAKISFLVPRATKHVLPDGTSIEYGDEILGPRTEYLEKWMRERLPRLPSADLQVDSEDEPYRAASDPDYFEGFDEKKKFREGRGVSLDVGVSFANLNVRQAQGRTRWGEWRDTVATKWLRVEHPGPESIPVSLVWWRDYTGRECRVMAWKDQVIIEPDIDFSGMTQELGLTTPR